MIEKTCIKCGVTVAAYENPTVLSDLPKDRMICYECSPKIEFKPFEPEDIDRLIEFCSKCIEIDDNTKPPLPAITRTIRYETTIIDHMGDINKNMIVEKVCRNVNDYKQ